MKKEKRNNINIKRKHLRERISIMKHEISIGKKKKKENGEAKKAVDKEVRLVICSMVDNDETLAQEEKKVSFINNVKFKTLDADQLLYMQEAGMMCTYDGQSFYSFTKNTWIGDEGVSCDISSNNTGT